jgi:dihydrodipicolinate reductase
MPVILVGAGKLATEILEEFTVKHAFSVFKWGERNHINGRAIVVHAGSGREIDEVIAFCEETGSALVELATGSKLFERQFRFPVIVCPNTNVLMLKFMALIANSGRYFNNHQIKIVESHQAEKNSVPGTAVKLAELMDISANEIQSVRDPIEQLEQLHIPPENLARHAYHRILIEDGGTSLTFETKVFGRAPYAEGLSKIISAVETNKLENRRYDIIEFVQNGWI